jgi:DNA-binding SARP family transcriptional activator
MQLVEEPRALGLSVGSEPPILICLLGSFRLLARGRPAALRAGGKTIALLAALALRRDRRAGRDLLIETLWPDGDAGLAGQALHSLVHRLHRLLGPTLSGEAPVVFADGCYRLNAEAGVEVDTAVFEALVEAGGERRRAGDRAAASALYRRALDRYTGDLCTAPDAHAVVERERLRARWLNLLAHLADDAFAAGDHAASLGYGLRLLAADPCREDALRLVMRCYVQRGERVQALRQYRLCEDMLRAEFDARPELATVLLFDQIRLDPASV